MAYRLEQVLSLCTKLNLDAVAVDEHCVELTLGADGTLVIMNIPEDGDTLIGFKGTPWHAHDTLVFNTGDSAYVELDELQLVQEIHDGNLLIASRFVEGQLADRWLHHKREKVSVRYIEAGEEIRIRRWKLRSR